MLNIYPYSRLAIKYIKHLQYLLSFPPHQTIPQHIVAFDPVHPAWGKSASVPIGDNSGPMIVHVLNRRNRNNRDIEDGEIIINGSVLPRSSRRLVSQPVITSYSGNDKKHISGNEVSSTHNQGLRLSFVPNMNENMQ